MRSPWKTWPHSLNGKLLVIKQTPPLVAIGEDLEQQLGAGPAEREITISRNAENRWIAVRMNWPGWIGIRILGRKS